MAAMRFVFSTGAASRRLGRRLEVQRRCVLSGAALLARGINVPVLLAAPEAPTSTKGRCNGHAAPQVFQL